MTKAPRKSVSLRKGRPPLLAGSKTGKLSSTLKTRQSARATRTLIRAHHNLHKSRAKAAADGDQTRIAELDAEIQQLGGLEAYQVASLTGQSKDRGGDSSALLVKWLEEGGLLRPEGHGLRVLEVGALSSQNAISAVIGKGIDIVRRIDLKSQEAGLIEEIDFMSLSVPQSDAEKFDIVSMSLVLNYVPEAGKRGEMLGRVRSFLRTQTPTDPVVPCMFLVLPLPCISNSRYLTADKLHELMTGLGYESIRVHQSAKLHYQLFHLRSSMAEHFAFKKVEVNPGKARNNFCITVAGR